MMDKLGLIAGGGALPLRVAERCRQTDRPVFVVRLKGFAEADLTAFEGADIGLGEFGKCVDALKRAGCRSVCLAGIVKRPDFANFKVDLKGMRVLPGIVSAAKKGDDALLRQVLKVFEDSGFAVEGADDILGGQETLPAGALGAVVPREADRADLLKALHVARAVGELDVGQGAVVSHGLVLAVEAQEGTDAMLSASRACPRTFGAGRRRACWPRRPSPSRSARSTCR